MALCIINSIRFLCEQLDPVLIVNNNLPPLLEIKLGLYSNDVFYMAEDGSGGAGSSALDDAKGPRKARRDVWQIVNDWVDGFFNIGNIMMRMDGSHYMGDLKKNENIVKLTNTLLRRHLEVNQRECEVYRSEYTKYEALWKLDRTAEFNKFLASVIAQAKKVSGAQFAARLASSSSPFSKTRSFTHPQKHVRVCSMLIGARHCQRQGRGEGALVLVLRGRCRGRGQETRPDAQQQGRRRGRRRQGRRRRYVRTCSCPLPVPAHSHRKRQHPSWFATYLPHFPIIQKISTSEATMLTTYSIHCCKTAEGLTKETKTG